MEYRMLFSRHFGIPACMIKSERNNALGVVAKECQTGPAVDAARNSVKSIQLLNNDIQRFLGPLG